MIDGTPDSGAGLQLDGVDAGYGDVPVLHAVGLDVGPGETVAVLGANGSGKSTLAKTIVGLTRQTRGSIRWSGSDVSRLATWRRIAAGFGYVAQIDSVFASLTVHDNLLVSVRNLERAVRADAIATVFELLPVLGERRRQLSGNLSGGERRMLALGTVLLQRPRLLILDEPTSDLSPALIDVVIDRVAAVRDRLGVPMVLVEQNVPRALDLASRVCVLARGSVVLDVPVGKVDESQLAALFLERR